jgi:hypothetical protein
MNTVYVSEDESDDFTDEEEEERKRELEEQQRQKQQQSTPTGPRRSSISDNQLYHSTSRKSSVGNSQWYIDVPKNTYLEPLTPQSSYGNHFQTIERIIHSFSFELKC